MHLVGCAIGTANTFFITLVPLYIWINIVFNVQLQILPVWYTNLAEKQMNSCATIRITNRCDFLYYVFISFFLVFSLHVSGFHGPIIRGISSCCFYATIWFMQCFVGHLCASADWFVVVTSVYSPQTSQLPHANDQQSTA